MLWSQQCMSGDAASKYRQRGRITGLQVCIGCSNYLYLYQIMLNNQQQASTLPTSIVHNRRGQDNRQLMRCIHSTTPHVHSCECYRSLEISEDYVTGLNFVNLNRQDRASCTIKLNNPQLCIPHVWHSPMQTGSLAKLFPETFTLHSYFPPWLFWQLWKVSIEVPPPPA